MAKNNTTGQKNEVDNNITHEKIKRTARDEYLAKNLTSRLNRIEGQVRGIKGMIERDSYCDDVLNQITAVRSALSAVALLVLENHVKSCLVEKIQDGELEIVDELLITIDKML